MRFRPSWQILAAYGGLVVSLLLVAGPLSRIYFASPLIGSVRIEIIDEEPAVPAITGGERPSSPAGSEQPDWRQRLTYNLGRQIRSWILEPQALKRLLNVALPGFGPAEERPSSLAVEGISLPQVVRRGFELAADVRLGQPWTLLAAELPAMRLVELPEQDGPLAVHVAALLPEWHYEQLLNAGVGAVSPGPDGGAGGQPWDGSPVIDSDPQVLIYHTHATEAYLGPIAPGSGINPNTVGFTPDQHLNVVRVGRELAMQLQGHGLSVIHVTEQFDFQNGVVTRGGAYLQSLRMLQQFSEDRPLLDVYPTVRLLVDLHRDSIPRDRAIVTIEGKTAARVLMVVGMRDNPRWQSNKCVTDRLHALMEQRYPGLSRGVDPRTNSRFNQHLPRTSLLLEIGSVENTLEEALYTVRLLAPLIAEALNQNQIPAPGAMAQCS